MKLRIIYVIIVGLVANIAISQSGVVQYKTFVEQQTEAVSADVKELVDRMIVSANKQVFKLQFCDNYSSFDLIEQIEGRNYEDKFSFNAARAGLTSSSQVFFDKKNNDVYEINSDGVITKETIDKDYWQITNETKKVDKYTCFKAFHVINFLTRKGDKTSRIITAWFSPSLPYSFGPKNYNGLPGLILELVDRKTTFIATSIELSKKAIEIKLPKGKTITKEEYDKKLKSQMGM
jgi:GLPGLI family protein